MTVERDPARHRLPRELRFRRFRSGDAPTVRALHQLALRRAGTCIESEGAQLQDRDLDDVDGVYRKPGGTFLLGLWLTASSPWAACGPTRVDQPPSNETRARRKHAILLVLIVVALGACGESSPSPTPRSVPSPSSVRATGTIGYVGCSNTWMAVAGYHRSHGPGRLWPALPAYGGGSVDLWANTTRYWTVFDAALAQQPVTAVWWHVCMHPSTTQSEIDAVVQQLRTRINPDTPIYASAMAVYQDPGECPMADPGGSKAFVQNLVSRGLVREGPMLSPLNRGNTASDGCHPSASEQVVDGGALTRFFG